MDIQVPNDYIPSELNGSVTIKFPYGEKARLPITLKLSKNSEELLEYEFLLIVNMEVSFKNQFVKYINFDLLKCDIEFPMGTSTVYLNILPTMVVNRIERYIRVHPRLLKYYNKLKLKLYHIMNIALPINRKMVIFQSTTGMNYSDNPRALYEEMLNKQYDMKAIWVVNKTHSKIDGNPKVVKPKTLRYYYYMAIGRYFINNGNFPNFYKKRKGTVHIQTWHGTPLKKLGFDIDPNSPSYKENTSKQLIRRNKRWDYLIAPNEYTGEILRRAYLFKNKMLNVGYPRNDIFYKLNEYKMINIQQTKDYLNIPSYKKVILYAPTWRDSEFHFGQANEPYSFKFSIERFVENFGDEYVLLIRLHPREAVRCQINDYDGLVYNVSNYDDIKHLYLIADILITDYSSTMFDFANTKRPIIFFTYDIEQYSSTLRGFYFDLQKEAPGPLVKGETELFHTIRNIEQTNELYRRNYEAFYNRFCSWENGTASEKVLNAAFSDLKKGV